MHKLVLPLIAAVLAAAVATGSPISPVPERRWASAGPSSTSAGKILWDFNTNG